MKQEKGITLIALIITVIMLIILAGVAISMALGENGLLNNSKLAVLVHGLMLRLIFMQCLNKKINKWFGNFI